MVYNLEVAGPHEYFANGVLVSNCACGRYWASWALAQSGMPLPPPRSRGDSVVLSAPPGVFERDARDGGAYDAGFGGGAYDDGGGGAPPPW